MKVMMGEFQYQHETKLFPPVPKGPGSGAKSGQKKVSWGGGFIIDLE